MLDQLFSSKTRTALLAHLFKSEKDARMAREILRAADVDIPNGTRELNRLVISGLVSVEKKGTKRLYRLNSLCRFYKPLKDLFDEYARGQGNADLAGLSRQLKLATLTDTDPWMLGEDIPDIDLFFSQIWLSSFANELAQPGGRAFRKILTVYRGYHLWFYYGERDSYEVAQHIVDKMVKDPSFAQKINSEIVRESDALRDFAEQLPSREELKKWSPKDLWDAYRQHDEIHTRYYQWGWLPVAADMFHSNFTETLKAYLALKKIPAEKANEYFVLLTQPTKPSLIQQEQEEFLEIVQSIQRDAYHKKLFTSLFRAFEEQEAAPYGLSTHTPEYEEKLRLKIQESKNMIKKSVVNQIESHCRKYFYVKHMYIGKEEVYTPDHYLKEVVKWVGRNSNAGSLLKQKKSELKRVETARKKLKEKLKLGRGHEVLFDAFGDFMVTKIYRRYAQIYALYRMHPLLEEIANRLQLSEQEVRFLLPDEVGPALLRGKLDREEVRKRPEFCVYYVEKGRERVVTGEPARLLAARAQTSRLSEEKITELKGQTGCMGIAEGIVKIVTRPRDMEKMNIGDVLVSIATDPDIVAAMKKAAAIVTEQGGVTSHAAIVSRELNIPCVIGTKIATHVLKDGDRVRVDANKGIVTLLS